MFIMAIKKIIKPSLVFIAIAALILGFFCVGMFQKTSTIVQGAGMTDMSVGGEQTCCGGSMSQHMQSWTNTFLATPNDLRSNSALLVLSLLAALIFIHSIFKRTRPDSPLLSINLYLRQQPNLFAFDPLKLAFAKGILHPKLY